MSENSNRRNGLKKKAGPLGMVLVQTQTVTRALRTAETEGDTKECGEKVRCHRRNRHRLLMHPTAEVGTVDAKGELKYT